MSHRKVHYNIFQITIARSKLNCTVLKHVQYLQFMIWRKKKHFHTNRIAFLYISTKPPSVSAYIPCHHQSIPIKLAYNLDNTTIETRSIFMVMKNLRHLACNGRDRVTIVIAFRYIVDREITEHHEGFYLPRVRYGEVHLIRR